MRRTPLAVLALMTTTALAACGDNSPAAPTEASPAVTTPAPGVPAQAAPEATATPQSQTTPAEGMQGGTDDWRKVANTADASLLGRLDQAWRMARAEAEEGGFSRQVEALGPLADPNAGQSGRVQPGQGNYRCRTIKMGSRNGSGLAYVEYPWFRCTVELTAGGDLILTKLTGSQRTRGLIYPDTDRRGVYIGAQAWGADENRYPAYGDSAERDQVGVIERIGQNRWRLVLPWPKQEAKLELLEITG
ncbi:MULTISPECIES: DUF4893 domain-containing protein [Brevundimonas]|uniref:DUF4893 domain-containing protein n=2 Tax=Brevundimonas TaxID=41275 RepID=A0ACD4VQG6_9CAUL|nr:MULTISPECIES: DUF4893 domain-containing protein [Brevundimonas]QSF55128.1 DUF4893 domain-containing protein [Brevundimonas fontaquae]WOB79321.1 DUF4893 domain-containing protein [Brevundimonas nasdae]